MMSFLHTYPVLENIFVVIFRPYAEVKGELMYDMCCKLLLQCSKTASMVPFPKEHGLISIQACIISD